MSKLKDKLNSLIDNNKSVNEVVVSLGKTDFTDKQIEKLEKFYKELANKYNFDIDETLVDNSYIRYIFYTKNVKKIDLYVVKELFLRNKSAYLQGEISFDGYIKHEVKEINEFFKEAYKFMEALDNSEEKIKKLIGK